MNCEQVEEGLSAYLDNMLASQERRDIAIHLQACTRCMMSLAELRQNDILLAQLPRVSPRPAVYARIFSSAEILELIDQFTPPFERKCPQTHSVLPRQLSAREAYLLPHLTSLPGGRHPLKPTVEVPATPPTMILHPGSSPSAVRQQALRFPLKVVVAALLIFTLCVSGLTLYHTSTTASVASVRTITSPASGPSSGEHLAAGTRFVFLHSGALWSTLLKAQLHQPARLTPTNVTVDAGWVVSPTLAGHNAGGMLAYVDLHGASIHVIRSDGQQDTLVNQPLLPPHTMPSSLWKTPLGQTILSSLTWSRDGNLLAFVASPTDDGQTALYLYSLLTTRVERIQPDLSGSVSHLAWSPDSTRLAFEVSVSGVVNILDYNIQSQGMLDLTNLPASQGFASRQILSLHWLPDGNAPALTWSLGTVGLTTSLWIHRVGQAGTFVPQALLQGTYIQALYSPQGAGGIGSWLVVDSLNGQAGDISRLDLTRGAKLVRLSQGKQVSLAYWSPTGTSVFYLDQQTDGIGHGYIVNLANGSTFLVDSQITSRPSPAWSADGRQLAYTSGARVTVVDVQQAKQTARCELPTPANDLSWSPATPSQLLISFGTGMYLLDTTRNTTQKLNQPATSNPVQWMQIS